MFTIISHATVSIQTERSIILWSASEEYGTTV